MTVSYQLGDPAAGAERVTAVGDAEGRARVLLDEAIDEGGGPS